MEVKKNKKEFIMVLSMDIIMVLILCIATLGYLLYINITNTPKPQSEIISEKHTRIEHNLTQQNYISKGDDHDKR